MDAERFDSLLRSLTASPSRRGALRLLAGSVLGGLLMRDPLSAEAKKGGKKKKCKSKKKVTICHKGQTIQVSSCALKGHQKHGDTVGECQPSCTANCNDKNCGANGCGGSCGACATAAGESCVNGRCGIACSSNTDCTEMTESCQGGRCQPVCTAQSCPGTNCQCGVRLETDDTRSPVCYANLITHVGGFPCEDDGECGYAGYDQCMIADGESTANCAAVEPCSCTTNADCPGVTTSCQGAPGAMTCQPVCPGPCEAGCQCAVRQETDGDRSAVCYSAVDYGAGWPCGNDAGCYDPPGSICVVEDDQTDCATPGFCANCGAVTECP